MKFNVVYIDDDEKELRKYKKKFRKFDGIKLFTFNTPKIPEDYQKINQCNPDLILVDFDLSIPDSDGNVIGLSGISLSTELKQKFPKSPIVLFTRKSVFDVDYYQNIQNMLFAIDLIIYKNEMFFNRKMKINDMLELLKAYSKMENIGEIDFNKILTIINAPKIDYDDIKSIKPHIDNSDTSGWVFKRYIDWVKNTLLKYPGILYDSIHASTYLGISEDSFLKEEVQDFFKKSKYTGIFSEVNNLWWKSSLNTKAKTILYSKEKCVPLRNNFPEAYKRKFGIELSKSICIYSKKSPADWDCYILRKPVMIQYTLSYRADDRPDIMDEARISFKSIRTSNDVNDDLLDYLGKELVEKIRKKRRGEDDLAYDEYPKILSICINRYLYKYLESESKRYLIDITKELTKSMKINIGNKKRKWNIIIPSDHSIKFKNVDIKGYKIYIDLYCNIKGENDTINSNNIVIRLWSLDERLSFRKNIDNSEYEKMFQDIGWKRVLCRFHFDSKRIDERNFDPNHHLHFGGIPENDEYTWYPKQLSVPRFIHQPMDLILAFEFILYNFYYNTTIDFRKTPEWNSLIKKSENIFIKSYYEDCCRHLHLKEASLLNCVTNCL